MIRSVGAGIFHMEGRTDKHY